MLIRIWMCWSVKCGAMADDIDGDGIYADDDVDDAGGNRLSFISSWPTLSSSAAPEYRRKDCG